MASAPSTRDGRDADPSAYPASTVLVTIGEPCTRRRHAGTLVKLWAGDLNVLRTVELGHQPSA